MKKRVLSVLAYMVATFGVQATSHFVINKDHYAALPFYSKDPIFALGVLSMVIQGSILAYVYPRVTSDGRRSFAGACKFAWLAGGILVSYMSLAEAAKFIIPSVSGWVIVEGLAGFAQFTVYGLLLGLVYRERAVPITSLQSGN